MPRHPEKQLKLRHFRIIEAISTHASILKASAALSLSQPALTRALREIEDALGVRLYDRHAKGVRETPFGELLAASARTVLGELRRLDEQLDEVALSSPDALTIGAMPVAAMGVLPTVVAGLADHMDQLQVRIVQGLNDELVPMLVDGRIDLVIGRLYEPAAPDGLVREPLYEEPFSLIARHDHPVFTAPGPLPERFASAKLALPSSSLRIGQEIDQILAGLEVNPIHAIRTSSLSFIREVVQSGDFVTILPRLTFSDEQERGRIRIEPLPVPDAPRPAGLIYRSDRWLSETAEGFIQAIRNELKSAAAEGKI